MKKGWQTKPLGEVLSVLRNGINCKQDKSGHGDKISRIESISEARFDAGRVGYAALSGLEKERFRLQRGDILFSHINSSVHVGKTAVFESDEEVYHGVNLLLMRSSSEVSPSYLERYLKFLFQIGYWRGVCKQSVNQASVNQRDVSKALISFPSSQEEQRRIVALLDESFAGLATAKANAERNLQKSRTIFENRLEFIYSRREEGWEEKRLGDLCQIKTGKKDVNQGNPEGEYPFFTCAAAHTFSDSYSFDAEALLVAGNGNVGQVSYYSGKFEAYQRTYVLLNFKGVTGKYLFHALDKRLSATVAKQKLGNTMPYIKMGMLTDFVVPVPPAKEQGRVTESLSAIAVETRDLAHIYERKLVALEELKKTLLQQAFNGEL